MGPIDVINHLLNFGAPAFAMALLTALFARHVLFRRLAMPGLRTLAGVGFGICLTASLAGLWLFGRDGTMATYGAMVLVCATLPWVMARAWKA